MAAAQGVNRLRAAWRRLWERLAYAHTPCWWVQGRPAPVLAGPARRELLVFVHGIYGSDQAGVDIGNFGAWPERLGADPRFKARLDLRLFSYRSFNLGTDRRYSIPEHAQRLRADLEASGIGRYHRVYFIAHSMGGLIVRQALLDACARPSADWLKRVGALFLLATPSGGAREAAWLARLGISELEAREMSPGSTYLRGLRQRWDAAFRARILGPRERPRLGRLLLALAAERRPLLGGEVVDAASVLAAGKHSRYRAFDLNHLQMAKAGPGNWEVYDWVARVLEAFPA